MSCAGCVKPALWNAGLLPGQHASAGTVSIPNFITLGRIILVPVVFWLVVSGRPQAAFYMFLVAGISDAVDGYLAKRFGLATELGAYLDPLADKLLLVSLFVALGVLGELPSWIVIAVVSRDLLIVMAILLGWVINHPLPIRPFRISKINTAMQIGLVALVLADNGFDLGLAGLRGFAIWLTALLTLLSLGAYLDAWIRHMSGYETPPVA